MVSNFEVEFTPEIFLLNSLSQKNWFEEHSISCLILFVYDFFLTDPCYSAFFMCDMKIASSLKTTSNGAKLSNVSLSALDFVLLAPKTA